MFDYFRSSLLFFECDGYSFSHNLLAQGGGENRIHGDPIHQLSRTSQHTEGAKKGYTMGIISRSLIGSNTLKCLNGL